ncbi:hypothetical protein FOCC_FOCC012639 [Frankliniella occidentalis]|nr:hypothetical protein FOCC_FOCC012639 [Frankliniella occidentalis]
MCAENIAGEKRDATAKKRLIMFNGEMVPWVAVKRDGGWCKRVYGHSYNHKSGVACTNISPTLYLRRQGKSCTLGLKMCVAPLASRRQEE